MENSRRPNYLVNWGSRIVYKFMSDDPIGRDSDGSPVYRVAYSVAHETSGERSFAAHEFLAMKTVNSGSSVPETLSRNLNLPGDHKNLTRVEALFIDGATGDLCIVIPFFKPGSLRSAMAARFPQGLPETCISVSLRCALKAVRFLHHAGNLHRDINAGHIYLKSGPQIKLGFGATLYEHGASASRAECSSSSSLPATAISTWAAAPEVYNSHRYSEKSDIWLVGITALELAYGRVTVPNREALEMTIRTITETKRLPKKLGPEGQQRAVAAGREDIKGKAKMEKTDWEEEEEGEKGCSFSRKFGEFVAQCLAWNPESRPSVDALLNHGFLCKKGLKRWELKSHFQDVLIRKMKKFKALEPTNWTDPKFHISIPGSTEPDSPVPISVYKPPDSNLGSLGPRLDIPESPSPASAVPFKLRFKGPKRKLSYEEDEGKPDEEGRPRKLQGTAGERGVEIPVQAQEKSASLSSWLNGDNLAQGDQAEVSSSFSFQLSAYHPQAEFLEDPGTHDVYRIIDRIGVSLPDNFPVFRAAYLEPVLKDDSPRRRSFVHNNKFVSIKIVNSLRDRAGYWKLKHVDVQRSDDLLYKHSSFVNVDADFLDMGSWDYCVVMGFAEYGSLRTIMAEHFPGGLPEACILLVLRRVLEGVGFLHSGCDVHGEINAGHVYVFEGPGIRLGYAATAYEHRCSGSGALPEVGISDWAAAPEVCDGEEDYCVTQKGDVWLVGILALELAYGRLRVPSGEALQAMIGWISVMRRLPGRIPAAEEGGGGEEEEGRRFSAEFEEFVASCLDWDAAERPSASVLLTHEFFTESGMENGDLEALFDRVVIDRFRK
ncbi:unnamed protein product [Cuscuta campestris]|uniref:Protein kinase domain-containing protein n=1 Tax=Cuscuta campestris TaxID=132261 RepID=A0A484MBN1_9ASTE|nr:unnamed protein product [Cuscuta campestris]